MTYVIFAVALLVITMIATLPTLRRLPARPLLLTAGVLVALTLVFDNIIVGTGIVEYDEGKISGLRLPWAPIEDFSYALAAALLVPALWTWVGPRASARQENP